MTLCSCRRCFPSLSESATGNMHNSSAWCKNKICKKRNKSILDKPVIELFGNLPDEIQMHIWRFVRRAIKTEKPYRLRQNIYYEVMFDYKPSQWRQQLWSFYSTCKDALHAWDNTKHKWHDPHLACRRDYSPKEEMSRCIDCYSVTCRGGGIRGAVCYSCCE